MFLHGQVGVLDSAHYAYNVEGTQNETPPAGYDSWIDYWTARIGDSCPLHCCNLLCNTFLDTRNRVGAHVRLEGEPDDDWAWIVPLCASCNNANNHQAHFLFKGTELVRVRMSRTRKTNK